MTASPAAASLGPSIENPALAYVEARAAAMSGDHGRSAELLAALAQMQPDELDLARKALSAAIGAGQMDLALRLAQRIPPARLSSEARMLIVTDALKRKSPERAQQWLAAKGDNGDLAFLAPLVTAWTEAERGDQGQARALAALGTIPNNSLLTPLRDELNAFILLKFRRTAEAEPFARRAIGTAGARENRIRLALADGFLAAGDRARALIMIDGMGSEAPIARQRIMQGKPSGLAIDTQMEALSEALVAFGADLARMQRVAPPVGLVQVARYADPQNTSATVLLALLLENQERNDEALALLRAVSHDDPLISAVRDLQARILTGQKKFNEAYAIAGSAAARGSVSDLSRLGEVFQAMDRHHEAAEAYGRAIALATSQGLRNELWTLHLLRASALEEVNRWPEARQALEQALLIAPEQPLLLNFLGYGKLERGEDLDAAEAMIRKASELAPEDASIIDSLGWAQFKRGKVGEAIATLQRAAEKDPSQAEIQEHLGDALYTFGQRFQARFAWEAALVTAEDEIAARVRAKLAEGLTPANAAP